MFGVLAGRSSDALSLIQNFFDNSNSYIIYMWFMIDKHQLIKSSMNMLAEGVELVVGLGESHLQSVLRGVERRAA